MEKEKILFGAGQKRRYERAEDRIYFKQLPYTPVEHLQLEPFEIHEKFADKDYIILTDNTEVLPGVTSEMIDWWWANMEKGYYLWAPGEHYGFDWLVPPCEGGYDNCLEATYEFNPVEPLLVARMNIGEYYPLKQCYDHVCMSSFKSVALKEGEMILIHTWKDVEGGVWWRNLCLEERRWYDTVGSAFANIPEFPSHMEYEAGRLCEFLPTLYDLWKDHPDPWENVHWDMRARQREDGTWEHICPNHAPTIDDVDPDVILVK